MSRQVEYERLLKAFGSAVRRRRLEMGLSQEELGRRTGLHRTYMSDLERGTRNLALVNILKVAVALEVEASELIPSLSGEIEKERRKRGQRSR